MVSRFQVYLARNLLLRSRHRELKIAPHNLPPTRVPDPKEHSRRDGLALIPNLDCTISDEWFYVKSESAGSRTGMDIHPLLWKEGFK